MRATGIVRRIDDLGRIVIPKEIRRIMKIKEGDSLEIYTDNNGEVIFKKYSPVGELIQNSNIYVEALGRCCELPVIITDRDTIVAQSTSLKRDLNEKSVSKQYEKLLESRSAYIYKQQGIKKIPVIDETEMYTVAAAIPIIVNSDVCGSVCIVSVRDEVPSETDIKLITMTANIIAAFL